MTRGGGGRRRGRSALNGTQSALVALAALAGVAGPACGGAPSVLVEIVLDETLSPQAGAITSVTVAVSGTPEDDVTITLPASDSFEDGRSSFLYRPGAAAGTLRFDVSILLSGEPLGEGSVGVEIPRRGRAEVSVTIGGDGMDAGTDGDTGSLDGGGDAGDAGLACTPIVDDYCIERTLVACAGGMFQAMPCPEICLPGGTGVQATCAEIVPAVTALDDVVLRGALDDPTLGAVGFAWSTGVGFADFNGDTGAIWLNGIPLRSAVVDDWDEGIYFGILSQAAGPDIGVFVVASLVLGPMVTLGQPDFSPPRANAVAILAAGEIRIEGAVEWSAGLGADQDNGPGGFRGGNVGVPGLGLPGCGGAGGLPAGNTGGGGGAGGGGGGAAGDNLAPVIAAGGMVPAAAADLSLLIGGCGGGGGAGGGGAGAGGGGGGALYLGARGSVFVAATAVLDLGGNGGGPASSGTGGGGGGAGGTLLIEAPVVTIDGAIVAANGGGGAGGRCYAPGGDATASATAAPGGDGAGCAGGGAGGAGAMIDGFPGVMVSLGDGSGGGGGAAGRVHINTLGGVAVIGVGAMLSPGATFGALATR